MRDWLSRRLRAAIGDDGTGRMWDRLTPDGRQVLRFAFIEARELGHPCIADEHVLLGVLRHGESQAATLLEANGLTVDTARADLLHVGPTLGSAADPANALRRFGVDIEDVRQRLEATFGTEASDADPAGEAGTRGPVRCASTCWPNAPSRSPPDSPLAEAMLESDPATCSTGYSRTPSTRSAPSSAAAAAGSSHLSASPPADPTPFDSNWKHAASNSPHSQPSSTHHTDTTAANLLLVQVRNPAGSMRRNARRVTSKASAIGRNRPFGFARSHGSAASVSR